MSYTVLARKYRSQTFDNVIGQDPISTTLKNAIKTSRVAHAFLFVGTRGVGKTTMARILAKSLNCLNFDQPTTEPCCKCESCVQVNLGEDIDVIEIDGASNNSVDQVRQLRENAIYRPTRCRYKIYIIDEVHMLSTSAFNALLKILEEPPSHVKFIFATTEPNKVIPTIQSRCQRFDFSNINPAKIIEHLKHVLKKEKVKCEEDVIIALAKMANGSMRDALSLLDRLISAGQQPITSDMLQTFLGCPNSEKVTGLVERIGDHDGTGALEATEDLVDTGLNPAQIADALVEYMRDLMVIKTAGDKSKLLVLNEQQRKTASMLAEKFDIAALVYNITALQKMRWTLVNNDAARALLDASILRFTLSEHFLNVDSLLSALQGKPSGDIKKKPVANSSNDLSDGESHSSDNHVSGADLPSLDSLQAVVANWQGILQGLSAKIGNGTVALLSSAQPNRFEQGVLTLTFDKSARMAKAICENGDKKRRIEAAMEQLIGEVVKINFELIEDKPTEFANHPKQEETEPVSKDRVFNDPAVKQILTGLGARVVDIKENRQ